MFIDFHLKPREFCLLIKKLNEDTYFFSRRKMKLNTSSVSSPTRKIVDGILAETSIGDEVQRRQKSW